MRQQSKEGIVILFIGAVLALNYPFLGLFDRGWMPFGIPLLYLYLYLVWLFIIVLLIRVVERSEVRELSDHSELSAVPEPASRTDPTKPGNGNPPSMEWP